MAQNGNANSNRRRKWLIILAVIAAAFLLVSFMSMGRKTVPVRVEKITRGNIAAMIYTNGRIEPVNNFQSHAPAPATVERILVHEGDQVKAGQMLVELSAAEARAEAARAQARVRAAEADLQAVRAGGTQEEVFTTEAQVAKAQTEVENAQRNLEALQRLAQKGSASAGEVQAAQQRLLSARADLKLAREKQTKRFSNLDVERAQAQLKEARAALAAAQDLLRHSEIRAPFAGTVYSLPVRQGQFVNAGDLLVQVADLSIVQVRAFVDEPDIGRLRQGQPVYVNWDGLPGRVWEGTVTRVPSTVVALGSRNVGEITCQVDNADRMLLPNLNVSVTVITDKADDTITVTREALRMEDGTHFVYLVQGDKLVRRDVQPGMANLTRVQITKGLNAGDEVCIASTNGRPLAPGMQVRVVSR
ncbi:MAG: efflux RND transporter periplasmic adaptor subunit [Terriglobales bacterium]